MDRFGLEESYYGNDYAWMIMIKKSSVSQAHRRRSWVLEGSRYE